MPTRRIGAAALLCLLPLSTASERQASWLHLADVDGDRLDDALVIGPAGAVSLLVNRGSGRFEDVTSMSGLDAALFASCALFADFDGDGSVDLYTGSGEVRVWRNAGGGVFTPLASGIEHDFVDLEASALDHDRDGRLDLLLHTDGGDLLYRNVAADRFELVELPESARPARAPSFAPPVAADGADDDAADDAADETPAHARRRRWLRMRAAAGPGGSGGSTAATSIAATTTSASSLGTFALAGAPTTICAGTVEDQATETCIEASSVGVLGSLYPLSSTFFVDSATSRVGVGTTTPLYTLHVAGKIVSGSNNSAAGSNAAVGGGSANSATSMFDTVGGGEMNTASGAYSTIGGGSGNTASGIVSTIGGGSGNTASAGGSSVPGGSGNQAVGSNSLAAGLGTTATGDVSTAMGWLTRADGAASTAVGLFNVGGGDPDTVLATNPIFEVGNGNGIAQRSNALTVLKNGNVGIGGVTAPAYRLEVDAPASNSLGIRSTAQLVGIQAVAEATSGVTYGVWGSTASPTGYAGYFDGPSGSANYFERKVGIGTFSPGVQLHVDGGSDATATGGGYAQFGSSTSTNIVIDNNEIMARSNGAVAPLSLNVDGGNVYISQGGTGRVGIMTSTPAFDLHVNGTAGKPGGGSWSVASDARLKKNVEDLDGALERLLELRGTTFEYIDPESIGELGGEHVGFIAQEVERVFPDWVAEKDDGTKYVTVHGFEALAVEALRELNDDKDRQIAELRAQCTSQAEELDALRANVLELAARFRILEAGTGR